MASDTPIYIELAVTVSPLEPFRDLFIAQLGAVGFESFSETEEGFAAYILKEDYSASAAMEQMQWDGVTVSVKEQEIEQVNWNTEWETNFDPIEVDDRVYIRAPFHAERNGFEYPMLIEPKMSFGTGHHQTTHMMIQHLLETDVTGKKTLDMGCGTAILAILAEMKGAQPIDAIDIDNWCYLNSIENADRNNCKHISVYEGDAALLQGKK